MMMTIVAYWVVSLFVRKSDSTVVDSLSVSLNPFRVFIGRSSTDCILWLAYMHGWWAACDERVSIRLKTMDYWSWDCWVCYHKSISSQLIRLIYFFFQVFWGHISIIYAEMNCLRDLLKYQWRYFINLSGFMFPAHSNRNLVNILKLYDGANDIEGTYKRYVT